MKTYQDTETGTLHAFEDGVDPFVLNNRNIPATLSEVVIPQPSNSHVWFNGNWFKDTEVPKDYKPPTSNVPAYNPAWMAFLNPYTFVLHDEAEKMEVSLEQLNSNSYDGNKLSEVVVTLPLTNACNINALISFDGAIAIPKNADYPSEKIALDNINRIFCALLLGGVHVEVISPRELFSGMLENKKNIFIFQDELHSRLRHQWSSMQERIVLMTPRIVNTHELRDAYLHGMSILSSVKNLSPFFLLHGYTAMVFQNRSDALSSLWITVEQLTSFIWENHFLRNPEFHPVNMKNRFDSLKQDNRTWSTSVKHELLWQTKLLSGECFASLSSARKQRNNLVHEGVVPEFEVIKNLWVCMFELLESASGTQQIGMRHLVPLDNPELGFPEKNNFSEWEALSEKLSDKN